MKKIFSILFLSLSFVYVSQAQTKQTPPPPGPAPKIELGKYESFTLKNGLKVYVVENHKQPVVSMTLVLDRDPLLEGDKAGYVEAAGSMMRTGTKTRSKDQFDEQVDFIGANLSFSSTGFSASSLKKHLPTLLDLTKDALLHPNFTQEELDKIKTQMLSGLAQEKDNPDAIARKTRNLVLFGKDHAYGEVMTEKTVENITLNDVQNYYNTYFRPNIGYLAVVGDVTPKEMKKLLTNTFKDWKKADVNKTEYNMPQPPAKTQVVIVDRPSSVQSVLSFTSPTALKPGAEDAIPAQLMNIILGGGMDARLFKNLRETHGYTYGAYSSISSDKLMGQFNAYGNVRNAVTDSAAIEFLKELSKIRNEKVTDAELNNAKAYMTGNFARGLENPSTVAFYAINTARYGLPADYYANYLKKVAAVTTADVQRVAQKYVNPEQLYIVAVGNAAEIADKLKSFDKDDNAIAYYSPTGDKVDRAAMGAPTDITAEQVLANYIKALGGKANIDKVQDISITSSASVQGMQIQMVQQQKAHDKFKQEQSMNNTPMMRITINGDKGKVEVPMQGVNKELTKEEVIPQKLEADVFPFVLYSQMNLQPKLTGMEKVDGQDAYVVEVAITTEQKMLHYFDKASGLRLKTVTSMPTPQGVMTQTKSYKNYKEVNGVKFPHTIEATVGPQAVKFEVQNIEVNKGLKDDNFKL
ncbi:insulinase family protein [Pontibacter sp. SGAir0037]|uniref:insulinase family protein n=1 Tax=Pontibacter sp. SGAir0037 TaxID=2571030 RepID=UPI0010CD546B|nr:insulinase family protein [Pontibacter sp. SGAir0037]QCR23884.1 peptidase M16 [Pontibacter sp. SGAir0037]